MLTDIAKSEKENNGFPHGVKFVDINGEENLDIIK